MLPYLGLDIEGQDGRAVRIEYSPNRPDYSTVYGIAAGLRYMRGKKQYEINVQADWSITLESMQRPYSGNCGERTKTWGFFPK